MVTKAIHEVEGCLTQKWERTDISPLSLSGKDLSMCRKYPGPRCSGATRKFMVAAKDRLDNAIAGGVDGPRIERLRAAYASHRAKFHNTPEYEKQVLADADKAEALSKTVKSPASAKGYLNQAERLRKQADYLRGARLASRASARSETLATWKETYPVADPNGGTKMVTSRREMSVAQAASYYNASVSGSANARNALGNISRAKTIRDSYEDLSPKQKELVEKFKKTGFPIRDHSKWDFSNSYHSGMEPNFHAAPKSFVPRTVKDSEGRKVPVTLTPGSSPKTTTVRLHDDNGLTHEAKVTIASVTDGDGKFYTVARFNGASALYGNRASQDSMDASDRGALLATDAPHWEYTQVLDEGSIKRDSVRSSSRYVRKFTADFGKEQGTGQSRISGDLGSAISKLGTRSINRRVRRDEPIMHSSLELTKNYSQTSKANRKTASV